MKRVISLTLVVVMCFLCIPVSAANLPEENLYPNKHVVTTTEEERDQAFFAQMDKIMNQLEAQNELSRGPKYHYKYDYLPYEYDYNTVQGYAGDQKATGGYRFPTGGGFWHTDSGGPEISGSINLSLPEPFNFVSFSINLGKSGSSGYYVTAPNTTDYFKLYVEKVIEFRPYITYEAPIGTEDWYVLSANAVPVVYSVTAYAKKV